MKKLAQFAAIALLAAFAVSAQKDPMVGGHEMYSEQRTSCKTR